MKTSTCGFAFGSPSGGRGRVRSMRTTKRRYGTAIWARRVLRRRAQHRARCSCRRRCAQAWHYRRAPRVLEEPRSARLVRLLGRWSSCCRAYYITKSARRRLERSAARATRGAERPCRTDVQDHSGSFGGGRPRATRSHATVLKLHQSALEVNTPAPDASWGQLPTRISSRSVWRDCRRSSNNISRWWGCLRG